MGRNKIKIEKIENSKIRQVTFYKRKRGLLKKAMELSLLCESKIFLCIVDKIEKLTIYCSENNINNFLGTYIQKLNQNKIQHKDILSNNDYHTLFNIHLSPQQEQANDADKDIQGNDPPKSRFYSSENIEYEDNKQDVNMKYLATNSEQPFETNPNYHGNNNGEKENELNLFIGSNHDSVVNEIDENSGMKRQLTKEDFPSDNINIFYNGSISQSTDNLSGYSMNPQKLYPKSTFTKIAAQNSNPQFQLNYSKGVGTSGVTQTQVVNNKSTISNKMNTLNQKRGREEVEVRQGTGNDVKSNENTKNETTIQKFNITSINPENLANLQSIFPLNFLSQNMGVINWVVPSDVLKNNVSNCEEKNDKL